MVHRLGVVATEGGPLLIADRNAAIKWNDRNQDREDYWRACEPLDSNPELRGFEIRVADKSAVIWDMPTGVAEVWRLGERTIGLTYSWLSEAGKESTAQFASMPLARADLLGRLAIESGWLAVIWAADAGSRLAGVSLSPPATALDLSVGNSAIRIPLPNGRYAIHSDEVRKGAEGARRAFVAPDERGAT